MSTQFISGFDAPGAGVRRHVSAAPAPRLIPAPVQSRLSLLSRRCGDRPGYLDAGSGEVVTWSQVARQAADWARFLTPGTVVGLLAAGPAAFCRAYLAGLAAGVCVAPLDPGAAAGQAGRMLETLQAADLVVDGEDTAATVDVQNVNLWISSATGLRQARRGTAVRLGAPGVAVLLPTSGTTGRPKLVPLAESQLLMAAGRVATHHALTPLDRGYSPLPLFHVNAQVVGILSTFVAGGSLVVDDHFHASRFWAAADDFQVSWLNLVPAILGILGEGAPPAAAAARRVRFARSASAPLPRAVQDRFEAESGIGVLETYGMTEAASQIAANPLARSQRRPGSAGRPTGVAVRIAGPDGGDLPPGETGAVQIRGPQVIGAYLGPGRTRIPARGADGWLHTGDLAFRDSDGFLYLAGRSDDVINRGGEKVHPREIEDVLLSDPHVRGAAVVGRPHRLLGEECVAYIVPDPGYVGSGPDRLAGKLLDRCRQVLSPHQQPARVIVIDALPTGPTGKPDRRALRAAAARDLALAAAPQRETRIPAQPATSPN
ncbi:MAG: Acyl-CoA synthetase (AMP-forming)/AMP-acid ligase [Actinomycetia bacterium]|nr:Acyl-CoA synthetase (AMP-forming)/AMP-acid ligase [Actinomycetes bacterium]